MLKISNVDLDWTDPYDQLDGQAGIKLIIVAYQTTCLLLFTVLGLGIVSYERSGQDPQKRGLNNQILSQSMMVILTFSWIYIPLNTWRMLCGPLTGVANFLVVFLGFLTTFHTGFVTVEYFSMKYLAVVVFKQMLPIMDDFLAKFLLLSNLTLSALLSYVYMFTSDCLRYGQRLAGHQPSVRSESNVQVAMMEVLLLLQTLIPVFTTVKVRNEKRKMEPDHEHQEQTRNTSRYNEDTISVTIGLPMVILNTIHLMIDQEANYADDYDDPTSRLTLYLCTDLFYGGLIVIVAGLVYIARSKLRKHIKNMLYC